MPLAHSVTSAQSLTIKVTNLSKLITKIHTLQSEIACR